jgi:hypothetical protein
MFRVDIQEDDSNIYISDKIILFRNVADQFDYTSDYIKSYYRGGIYIKSRAII